jgi:hypothetical protein
VFLNPVFIVTHRDCAGVEGDMSPRACSTNGRMAAKGHGVMSRTFVCHRWLRGYCIRNCPVSGVEGLASATGAKVLTEGESENVKEF